MTSVANPQTTPETQELLPGRRHVQGDGIDSRSGKPRLLLVDDEQAILDALSRNMRPYYEVTTALGGKAALELLPTSETFAVAITDMRMPDVNGVAVLRALRYHHPTTVSMLLTGFAEMDAAIAAVNEGNLFRFLTKPVSPDALRMAINSAVNQHKLVVSERELLEGTLHGSIAALLDALSLANPVAFGRAARITSLVRELLAHVDVEDKWAVEIAAMCSQLGAVTLPLSVADKQHRGVRLDEQERAMVATVPQVTLRLLAGIPRLDDVRALLVADETWKAADAPIGAKLIRLAAMVDDFESSGLDLAAITAHLRSDHDIFGDAAIEAFGQLRRDSDRIVELVQLADLKPGMTLAVDVLTSDDVLLVSRGQVVSESLLLRLENLHTNGMLTTTEIYVSKTTEESHEQA